MLPGKRNLVKTIIFGTTIFLVGYKKPGRGSVGEFPQVFDTHALPPAGDLRRKRGASLVRGLCLVPATEFHSEIYFA